MSYERIIAYWDDIFKALENVTKNWSYLFPITNNLWGSGDELVYQDEISSGVGGGLCGKNISVDLAKFNLYKAMYYMNFLCNIRLGRVSTVIR